MNPLIMTPRELGEEILSAAKEDSSSDSVSSYIIYTLAFLARLLYVMIRNDILNSDVDVSYIISGKRY